MNRIKNLRIIEHFKSNSDNAIHGIYECEFNGEKKVFIRHGSEIGAVTFWLGEPLYKCIPIVKKDVAEELIESVEFELMSQK